MKREDLCSDEFNDLVKHKLRGAVPLPDSIIDELTKEDVACITGDMIVAWADHFLGSEATTTEWTEYADDGTPITHVQNVYKICPHLTDEDIQAHLDYLRGDDK